MGARRAAYRARLLLREQSGHSASFAARDESSRLARQDRHTLDPGRLSTLAGQGHGRGRHDPVRVVDAGDVYDNSDGWEAAM